MVHADGLEVAVAVAEVADVAWEMLERRHEHSAKAIEQEQKFRAADDELAHQQEENRRLRALLEDYQKALEHMQMQGAQGGGQGESEISDAEAGPSSSDPSGSSSPDLYERLKAKVDSPDFLAKLIGDGTEGIRSPERMVVNIAGCEMRANVVLMETCPEAYQHCEAKEEVLKASDVALGAVKQVLCHLRHSPVLRRSDRFPFGLQTMTPQELQKAISHAFTDLEKQGKLRTLWTCGRFMYAAASWGATAVGLYRNPIIVRAAMMAVWTSCCVVVRLLT